MPDRQESKSLLTRRKMLKLAGGTGAAAALVLASGEIHSRINAHRPETLGFTFSPWQCELWGLDVIPTLNELLVRLEPDVVRLGGYWHNSEPEKGRYNFGELEDQLNEVAKIPKRTSVILTAGMKAPRFPEFFFPRWVKENPNIDTQIKDSPLDSNPALGEAATLFVLKELEFAKRFPQIDYIQYENEPFNSLSVTKGRYLSEGYIANLINEGGNLMDPDTQKTLLTYSLSPVPFLNDPAAGKLMRNSRMADSAGKNLYISAPGYNLGTEAAILQTANLQRLYLNAVGVEDWVTECQAEPWEKGGIFPLREEYTSASPESAYNLARNLGGRGHRRVLMWGAEFWMLQQRKQKNPKWMKKMEQLFQGN